MTYRKAWEVGYQRDRAQGRRRYVDSDPARITLQHLLDAQVPLQALARSTGVSATGLEAIVSGRRTYLQRRTADAIAGLTMASVYEQQADGMVPKIGAVRRVQALMAMGWTRDHLDAAGATSLPRLLHGQGDLVTARKWREIREVYDRLSMTPGPSSETRRRALERGYAPPLAWDEDSIDDPAASPQVLPPKTASADLDQVAVGRTVAGEAGAPAALTRPERLEVIRQLAADGASDRVIGERLDVTGRTVLRERQRHGISSQAGSAPRDTSPSDNGWDWAEARSISTRPNRSHRDHHPSRPSPSLPAGITR